MIEYFVSYQVSNQAETPDKQYSYVGAAPLYVDREISSWEDVEYLMDELRKQLGVENLVFLWWTKLREYDES